VAVSRTSPPTANTLASAHIARHSGSIALPTGLTSLLSIMKARHGTARTARL